MSAPAVKAFLSYSHDSTEHKARVLALANRLRRDGIDTRLDQYEPSSPETLPQWIERQFQEADFVLVVCTETYLKRFEGQEKPGQGQGVRFEGRLIRQELYEKDSLNHRYLPICFEDTPAHIPRILRASTRYVPSSEEGYEKLRKKLLGEEAVARPPVGSSPRPSPEALEKALAMYKSARMADPGIRQLDLRALARINRGAHETELQLLDVAVEPSLCDEAREHQQHEAALWNKLRTRELEPAERQKIQRQLERMERARWKYDQDRRVPIGEPISFALALHRHRGLMVIGEPGAGKSVLTRLAFLACDEGRAGAKARELLCGESWYFPDVTAVVQDLRGLLPVHLTLGRIGPVLAKEELSIEELIRRQLHQRNAPHELLVGLGALLEEGRVFLLCDGLDEAQERQRWRVVEQVSEFIQRYPKTRLLMTSRPHGYHPRLPGIAHTRLAPLHERQQRALVWHLHRHLEAHRRGDAPAAERARRRTNALLQAIGTRAEWAELSSNPLLLTLSALTPTDEEGAPRHRVFVFQTFLETLSGEWRSALSLSQREAKQLIAAWSAVASQLLLQEEAHGATREHFLHLLTDALEERLAPATPDAETALHLALEMGLVRELEEGTVVFWHKTFAEFLAAHALTAEGRGAAERLLAQTHLPVQVLRLAAARLYFVSTLPAEVDELAEGLLQRDEHGAQLLLRPGLRAASACLAEGLLFRPALTERVWAAWADVLERTPPSHLWWDFVHLTEYAHLPTSLAERFAEAPDRGLEEVREALARLVSPYAAQVLAVPAACRRWLEHPSAGRAKLHGAFGLALANEWSDAVIEAVGHFREGWGLAPSVMGEVVRRGGTSLLERLRVLVRTRLASDPSPDSTGKESSSKSSAPAQEEEKALAERRLSAAFLLAVAGAWNPDVARVIALTLEDQQGLYREPEASRVVRACLRSEAVRQSVFEWLRDASTLGTRACALIRDEAPLIEGLPEQVLEQAPHTPDRVRQELESLLVELGEQQRALLPVFERGLEDEREEHRLCATRILRRLHPPNARLHEALRRGMRSQDALARTRWAYHAFGLDPSLDDAAMETLLDCARNPDAQVRQTLYERLPGLLYDLDWDFLDRWIACAKDVQLSASARFDAIQLVAGSPRGKRLVPPLLRPLLDAGDAQVRRKAALWLVREEEADADCVTLAVAEAARADEDERFSGWSLKRLKLPAATLVGAILRGLPDELPPQKSEERFQSSNWAPILIELSASGRACVEHLLDALERPWPMRGLVVGVLRLVAEKHGFAREALRERLESGPTGTNPRGLLGLVLVGLRFDETAPSAITTSRKIELEELTQGGLEELAQWLHRARAVDDAASLWRRVLEGKNLELVLRAAEALVVRFPEQVGAWLPPVLERLLDSPAHSQRVDAARIALRCGMLEERALAALLDCLTRTDQQYKRDFGFIWFGRSSDSYALASGPTGDLPLQEDLNYWSSRSHIDFEAMHALCGYRPHVALAQLHAWLEGDDWTRFRCAVSIFAQRDREALRAALLKRLRSGPTRDLRQVLYLVDEHDLYSTALAEQLLARYTVELPSWDDVELCLVQWMNQHPDLWALLREQPPGRRVDFGRLLPFRLPITRDAVAFVVDHLLATPDAPGRHLGLYPLDQWCPPPREEAAPTEEDEPTPSPELIRSWIREVLAERSPPADLDVLLLFDRIALLGGVPPGQRIELLRRALDIDIATLTSDEEEPARLLEVQAEAALRIHELQGHDTRSLPLLERLVLTLPKRHILTSFEVRLWCTLLALRPGDQELRHRFIRAVAISELFLSLENRLKLLALAGLSAAERIDVLLARIGLGPHPAWLGEMSLLPPVENEYQRDKALPVLVAIERLGCAPERLSTLLRAFVSTHGMELPEDTKLELARRSELPTREAAKLLLSVILNREERTQAQQLWMERFSTSGHDSDEDKAEKRWSHPNSEYLSVRLRSLTRLSQVKELAPVEAALVELTTLPADRLLPLYRGLRAGTSSSDAEWRELLGLLTVGTDDARSTRVAKEWLTVGLWQALEPSTLGTVP